MAKATTTGRPSSAAHVSRRRPNLWRFAPAAFIAAGVCIAYVMGWHHYLSLDYLAQSRETLNAFVARHPVVAPLGFLAVYIIAVAFSFPVSSVLTITAGFLFGWLLGGILAVVGATVGGTCLFLAARSAFGQFLRKKVGGFAGRLAEGFRDDAFVYLLVLRLAPFIPFVVVNIAPALFDVKPRTFVAATTIGIIPAVFAYAWLGQGVDSVLAAASKAGRAVTVSELVTPEITVAFAALALVAALAAIVRKVWASRRH